MTARMDKAVRDFNAELDKFAKTLVPAQVVLVQKKITLELLNRVVLKTPVDTGRARGNWQVGVNQEPEGEVKAGSTENRLVAQGRNTKGRFTKKKVQRRTKAPPLTAAGGTEVLQAGLRALAAVPPWAAVYVTNNVPYIEFLEQGRPGPGSPQAPEGMVAVTLEEMMAMFP